jgi:hypothetical protein
MASKNIVNGLKRSALTVALGLCFAGGVQAQSTSGSIFGKADAGQTVTIVSETGLTRTVTADAGGSFNVVSLPAGSYKVTSNGSTRDVVVRVGSGAQVDFGATTLDTVVVTASSAVDIDISQTDIRTVFTADDLQKFAVPRDVNSVALLAPGVINSTSYNFAQSNIGSFGGSAASENAYYINGYPVTNPLTNLGATTLGFDSIAQQQVLTGGYGAEYGRSTGGVVSLVTKKGTNEWHGGVYAIYAPASLRAKSKDIYYPDTGHYSADSHYPQHNGAPQFYTDNQLFDYNSGNKSETLTYGLWAAGPIWKDRLFIYANAERTEIEQETSRVTGHLQGKTAAGASAISSTNRAQAWGVSTFTYPRWTVKTDWNITDNHILELTAIQDNGKTDYEYYGFNYDTFTRDNVSYNGPHQSEDNARLYIGKYTGYLTDNLTISAQYGEQEVEHVPDALAGYDASKTFIAGLSPTTVPTQFASISNPQPYQTIVDPSTDNTEGYRFDVTYQLGDHELRAGLDHFEAISYIGDRNTGPGYLWSYGRMTTPTEAISASDGVGSPNSGGGFGTQGYFVSKNFSAHGGSVSTEQQAWYIEDRWQVTDNLLLSLGLRNDSFTNYNGDGLAYVEQKNNWAPRLGFSWDVNGDSKFKVFGNAGRYHLALPNNVAIRGANASLSTAQYFTYTGIAADGTPTGLTAIPMTHTDRQCANGGVSTNLECGNAPDPATVAIKGLKAHYQDEFILGMQRVESDMLSWGAKVTYRDLKSAIDDTCPSECRIFNPGEAATFLIPNGDGTYTEQSYTAADLGFPKLKRKYLALDLYAQYQHDDLFAKIEYTLSKNWGNAEGQLNSSIDVGNGGQADVSVTSDWDLPELAFGSDGLLPNHRKHQVKAFGSLKLSDQFRIGGSAIVQSGRPKDCKSYWPYAKPGLYNNGFYYFYCGVPGAQTAVNNPNVVPNEGYVFSPRGSAGTTPLSATFNLNFTYTPNWLEGLRASVDVLNLFDTQTASAYNPRSANSRSTVDPTFQKVSYYTSPRAVRFTVRYDF